MRDYSKVSPQFWIGRTGKALRGNPEAQVLAFYLMTSTHATMIGVYHCPVLYMAHETGLGMEGASKALQRLIELDFCTYEEATETVFVHRMAFNQIAESLIPADKRVQGLRKDVAAITSKPIKTKFLEIYGEAFHLVDGSKKSPLQAPSEGLQVPQEAPSKPVTVAVTVTGGEALPSEAAKPHSRGTRLPQDWTLPDDWKQWAENARPDLDVDSVAERFRDYWIAKPGNGGVKLDWQATWRNWVREQKATAVARPHTSTMFAGLI